MKEACARFRGMVNAIERARGRRPVRAQISTEFRSAIERECWATALEPGAADAPISELIGVAIGGSVFMPSDYVIWDFADGRSIGEEIAP